VSPKGPQRRTFAGARFLQPDAIPVIQPTLLKLVTINHQQETTCGLASMSLPVILKVIQGH